MSNIDLVAVCEVREDNARRAAAEAEALLGRRPAIHLSMAAALADPAIAAFDVVTDVASHVAVVLPALAERKPVLCEKPLGLTVRACRAMVDAAAARSPRWTMPPTASATPRCRTPSCPPVKIPW